MTKEQRDVLLFHIAFAILAAIGLLLPFASLGLRILVLVVIYNLALPTFAHLSGYPQVSKLWIFLAPISLMMIFPDWFLAGKLHVLVFPQTGAPSIGPIPIFMAGMWIIPLFIILYLGEQVENSFNRTSALIAVALLSLITFVSSEATLWAVPIWYAQNVTQIGHVALYVIVPEILFGLSVYLSYRITENKNWQTRLLAAYVIMVLYLGNLSLFYLLME
ncbi:MAG: hypothetical protein ABI904_08615 [Chloroflexota bacterium]